METDLKFTVLKRYDKAGIICSGACAVHCLLLPVVAYSSPVISNYLKNEWIHIGLLVALLPIACIAFLKSKKIHRKSLPLILGTIGIAILFSAITLEAIHIEIQYLEKALTAVGSILLITGHLFNILSLKKSLK